MMNEIQLAELFVRAVYPETEGWRQLHGHLLETVDADFEVDMVMYKKGEPPVAVLHMSTPYVSTSDMKMAAQLKQLLQNRLNGREAKVLLVYRELLSRPQSVPRGIYIMTITEGDATTHGCN